MKKILFFFLFLSCFPGYSQQSGSVSLNWSADETISFGTYSVRAPQFDTQFFFFDNYNKEIFLNLTLPQNAPVNENSLQITNTVYTPITPVELGELATNKIPTAINAKLINSIARDKYSATVHLSPIIRSGSGYQKLISFSYTFNNSVNSSRLLNANSVAEVTNSVLSNGEWYRFYVEKSGIYKISKSFLQSLGLNVGGDPRKIKIYGNGGRMLPLLNGTYYPDDLAENAIYFPGDQDGQFGAQDFILFYAEGTDNYNPESDTHSNLYADRSYYYVTASGANGKRITDMPQPNSPSTVITTFEDYQYHERDLINIVRTGRRWFGEQFGVESEQEFEFDFPGVVSSEPASIKISAAAAAPTATTLQVDINGSPALTFNFMAVGVTGDTEANGYTLTTSAAASESMTVKVTYNNNGVPGSRGFLDYIVVKAKRQLRGYGTQYRFENNSSASTGVAEYQFLNAAEIMHVWDITDINNVKKIENSGQGSFSFTAGLGDVRKYIVVDDTDFFSPQKESKSKVANQNLHGTIFKNQQGVFEDIDYLIITPAFLNSQAERLANFHRTYSGLNVKVVNVETIYPEFSSGKQDIGGIRNFIKYVYQNASSPAERVKYVNLFGDASFDYKERIDNNSNIVPIFHSMNSYTVSESSFASDDFYALMDPNEGRMDATTFGGLDLAVGRILAETLKQAEEMVTKILDYHDIKSYGSWRNNYVFIADDADVSGDMTLQVKQNQLADEVAAQKPFLNIKKILLDSYDQESASGGSRYPKAREELFNAFEKGALVFNYLGHGGEAGLSTERIWEMSDGINLSNRYRYPLFITITCDFSRFDNPFKPTAGENTFWNPTGGAIAMITTVRSIAKSPAEIFNDKLSEYLLSYVGNNSLNVYPTIAEALRLTKNTLPNSSGNVVLFLGDPAMMLAIPKPMIRLTKVNDVPVSGPIDDFESLDFIKLTGEVTDENNMPLSNYNGELAVNIFDKEIARTTLNNDGSTAQVPYNSAMNFNVLGETIFRGNASVTNGQFEFGFVVPRDIRVPLGNGRISFYAKRNQVLLDKTGYNTDIKIGGINENAAADNVGPTVKLYMNDQTFISGGITNESPIFLAYLEDENGINTASGIGHDIIAILDGDESNPYVLNDYYETELDNYKKGHLAFPLRNLEKGLHTITFKAWDVYNNPITSEIQFIVVGDETITLKNVLNYPNPFTTYTQFWFTHNRPFEPLDVQVQVMTITGKIVWTRNQVVTTDGFLSREIIWDGKDDFGDRIGKGVYVYKLTVRSTVTNTKSEKYEKLVIL
ncbi:MAG TPA: type IX secretion system sortase PorU [Flavobacterium sp.]